MSMQIFLYKNNSDRKQIVKDLENFKENGYSCKLKEPCSILRPSITIRSSAIGKQWAKCNYAYIPSFNRYYFIDNITCLNDGLLQLDMSVDVLQTYQYQIMTQQQQVVRSEYLNSKMYIDTELPLQANKIITIEQIGLFPEATGNNYILTTAGGS